MTLTQRPNAGRMAAQSIVVLSRAIVYGIILALSFIGLMFTAEAFGVGNVGRIALGTFCVVLATAWGLMHVERWKASFGNDAGPELIDRDSEWETVLYEWDDGYGISARLVDGGVELRSFNEKDEVYQNAWVAGSELETVAEYLAERAEIEPSSEST